MLTSNSLVREFGSGLSALLEGDLSFIPACRNTLRDGTVDRWLMELRPQFQDQAVVDECKALVRQISTRRDGHAINVMYYLSEGLNEVLEPEWVLELACSTEILEHLQAAQGIGFYLRHSLVSGAVEYREDLRPLILATRRDGLMLYPGFRFDQEWFFASAAEIFDAPEDKLSLRTRMSLSHASTGEVSAFISRLSTGDVLSDPERRGRVVEHAKAWFAHLQAREGQG